MTRLPMLKNREYGQPCILVCNGLSLNRMDLRFLRKHTCIGLNKIFLGFKKFGFYPKYYVSVNDRVIEQSAEDIKALNCVKFISQRNAHWVPENALTHHINTQNPLHRFCTDITQGVHEGWTVTYAALQIAYYLGFKEVVIVGMDHRYTYHGQPNETHLLQGDDLNHFSSDYFAGQRWDNPDLSRSEESYQLARQIFEADGRRIIDATLNGACQVFEKRPYTQVFQNDL